MRVCFFLLMGLIFWICPHAVAGTINTKLTTHANIKDGDRLDFRLEIENRGDVAAHNVSVELFIQNVVRRYPDLGNNPSGGRIECRDSIDIRHWKPGKYTGIIRTDFEEQNGTPHSVYHLFTVKRDKKGAAPGKMPVEVTISPPRFNRKAFWRKTEDLTIHLINKTDEPARTSIRVFAPDGFEPPSSNTAYPLAPGREKVLTFPIHMAGDGMGGTLYLVVSCELKDAYYASGFKSRIETVDEPVLFKWYLYAGIALLILMLLFSVIAGRNRFKAHQTP